MTYQRQQQIAITQGPTSRTDEGKGIKKTCFTDDCYRCKFEVQDQFESLPQDILQLLLIYLDIPSIGALSQICRQAYGNVSQLASEEKTWLRLVNHRFHLFSKPTSSSSRRRKDSWESTCTSNSMMFNFNSISGIASTRMSKPKLYGGATWKEAYRNMARCNRIPRMKVTFKKKCIFAKGSGFITNKNSKKYISTDSDATNASDHPMDEQENLPLETPVTIPGQSLKYGHYSDQCVACWVMINHTEDCTLRSTSENIHIRPCQEIGHGRGHRNTSIRETSTRSMNTNMDTTNDSHHRFIELQLAFQNTKSGFCNVDVDVCKSTILMQDSSGDYITQRIIGHGTHGPKVVYRSDGVNTSLKSEQRCTYLDADYDVLSLKPFEFAIVSVCIPLTHYMERNDRVRFETDFLSRSLSVCTPISVATERVQREMFVENTVLCHPDMVHRSLNQQSLHKAVVVATFVDEHEIWENYMELPGGFLTLVDKRD